MLEFALGTLVILLYLAIAVFAAGWLSNEYDEESAILLSIFWPVTLSIYALAAVGLCFARIFSFLYRWGRRL